MPRLTVLALAAWTAGGGMAMTAQAAAPRGFVHAAGQRIVDGAGADLLLRGVNLGGWLLWESYLMRFEGHDLTESRMKQRLVDLVGRDAAFRFFRDYRTNHTTAADLRRIRELGWNCVRVPFNARILSANGHFDLEAGEGWKILDQVVDWCEAEGIFVVLDMHSAPGGQNTGGISDNDLKAGLFDGPHQAACRDEAAALWREIAKRYANRGIVAAYDLLNEPTVDDKWGGGKALADVYRQMIGAIREVDRDHLIMVEGNWYATDFHMFEGTALDANLCYQFHKYWDEPSPRSIRKYLDVRTRLNAPIWLGETGENNATWYAWCVGTMEEAGIGWCFWPWKRIGGGCVEAVQAPEAWRKTSAALGDPARAKDLSRADAIAGLDALATAVALAACREDLAVVRALKGSYEDLSRIPGKVDAADYDRCSVRQKGNLGGAYRPGDADIYEEGGEFVVRRLAAGDMLEFDVDALGADLMRPVLRGARGELDVVVDGTLLPAAGRTIAAGRHVVTVRAKSDGAALTALELAARPGRVEAEDFVPGREVGYHDLDNENHGKSKYRKGEGVSVQECSEGGYNIGWIEAGEWITWKVDVPHAGTWDLVIRYASLPGGGPLRISLDGRTLADGIAAPATGWWQNWADLRVPALALPAGSHVLRLDAVKGGFNLDYFLFLPR